MSNVFMRLCVLTFLLTFCVQAIAQDQLPAVPQQPGKQPYEFDLEIWLPHIKPESVRNVYSGAIVSGPFDLCNNEWLRRNMKDQYDWGKPVPTDVFLWAPGEPQDRSVTKIGGLPYRPADKPWPIRGGRLVPFLGQINFTQSKDITGELPGDVLLIFGEESPYSDDPFRMEWQKLGIKNLVQKVPVKSELRPYHGYRCRTANFPEAKETFDGKYPQADGKDVWGAFHVICYQATSIGPSPGFIQGDNERMPGKCLCTLSSVSGGFETPWPFIGQPEPDEHELRKKIPGDDLLLGDMGCIYVFIDEHQKLHVTWSCY